MQRNEIDSLRYAANSRILQVLDTLDIKYNERYNYVNTYCAVHGGDNGSAWSWLVDTGRWKCFTHNCEDEWGSDIFGLIRGIHSCDFYTSINKLREILDIKPGYIVPNEILSNSEFVRSVREEEKIYPEDCLSKLHYHDYLESRNYPRELISSYHIGVSRERWKPMSNRIIFPIRNLDGCIVGFSGRTIFANYKGMGIPKWYHSKGLRKDEHLFNIDRAAKYIGETGIAILVEGPLDVLRLEQAGIKNSVALMGISMSNKQVGLLIQCGARKLLIALDNDNAGKTGAINVAERTKSFFATEHVIIPDGYKDIGELSVEATSLLFSEKVAV